ENVSRNGTWRVDWKNGDEAFCKRFDSVLLAAPAHRIPALAGMIDAGELLEPLQALPDSPISRITLGYRRDAVTHPLDGFGALVPEKENLPFLRVSCASGPFPARAPAGMVSLALYVGGARQPDLATLPLQAHLEQVLPALGKLLGMSGDPVFTN